MRVGAEVSFAIVRDICNGVSKDETKIEMTPEASAHWDEVLREIVQVPMGGVVDVPYDGNDDGYLSHLYR